MASKFMLDLSDVFKAADVKHMTDKMLEERELKEQRRNKYMAIAFGLGLLYLNIL